MWNWLRELYEIRRENQIHHCESCEILQVELTRERREKERLLNHILQPQSADTAPVKEEEPKPIRQYVPWKVKQQELELRDRLEHQRIMKEFKDKTTIKTDELEKSMGIING